MSPSSLKPACEARSAAIVASANKEFRKRILKRLGARNWTVEEALGGAAALSLVEEGAFKAIFLDRWLPDLDVSELVDIIKARYPQVQVLVVGSEVEERDLVERLSPRNDLLLDFPDAPESRQSEIEAEGLRERPQRHGWDRDGGEEGRGIARDDGIEPGDATGLSSGKIGDPA